MIRSIALLAIATAAVLCRAQDGKSNASLKDTEAWMARTVNSGPRHPGAGHGVWGHSTHAYQTSSRTSIVFGPDAGYLGTVGCHARIVEINELSYDHPTTDADKKGYTTETVLEFNLKDIDPGKVQAGASPEAFVDFATSDDTTTIHQRQTRWNVSDYARASKENFISCDGPGKECTKREDVIVSTGVDVDSTEFAQRFARAFRHAVELCGEKHRISNLRAD